MIDRIVDAASRCFNRISGNNIVDAIT